MSNLPMLKEISLADPLSDVQRQIAACTYVLRERKRSILDEDGSAHSVHVCPIVQLFGEIDREAFPQVELRAVQSHLSEHLAAKSPAVVAVTGKQALPKFRVGDGEVDTACPQFLKRTAGSIEQTWAVLQGHLLCFGRSAGSVAVVGGLGRGHVPNDPERQQQPNHVTVAFIHGPTSTPQCQ